MVSRPNHPKDSGATIHSHLGPSWSLGLLLEEESTNLVNSNANAVNWISGSATQETTYPIKGLYTTRLMDLSTDGDSPFLNGGAYGTGSTIVVTMSMYIDAVNSTSSTVLMYMFGGGYINHQWNISSGVPVPNNTFSINGSNYNTGSAQAIDCGGGIYRLVLTASYTGSSTNTRFYVGPSGADSDYVIVECIICCVILCICLCLIHKLMLCL